MTNSAFHIVEMPDYEEETLKAYDIFSSNIVVFQQEMKKEMQH